MSNQVETNFPGIFIPVEEVPHLLKARQRVVKPHLTDQVMLEPIEVMSVAEQVHERGKLKISFNEVAALILKRAETQGPGTVPVVREQLENFFTARVYEPASVEEVIADARQQLPKRLFKQVARALSYPYEPPDRWFKK